MITHLEVPPIEVFAVKIVRDKGKYIDISPIKPEKEKEIYEIEKDMIKPILKSSDIQRYGVFPTNYYAIFPYKFGKKKDYEFEWSFINESEMKERFPKTLEYLKAKKHFLEEREEGRWKDSDKWYEYSRQQNFGCHKLKKIITPGISTFANYAIDEKEFYIDRGSYGIIINENENKEISYEFLIVLLNSNALDFYIKMTAPLVSGGYYSYQTKYLNKLPIVSNSKNQDVIIHLVHKITILKKLQHKFKEIWIEYSKKYRNNYKSLSEILMIDKQKIRDGNFDEVWTSDASIYPNGDTEPLNKEFIDFKVITDNNENKIKIYGIFDSSEELVLEIKTKDKELSAIIHLSIQDLLSSRSKVKSLNDIFSKTEIPIIQPNSYENSQNLIKGAIKSFNEWLNKQNFDIKVTDIINIEKEIQDIDNQIDAQVFKLYKLNKNEVEIVLDSLGIIDTNKNDILSKFDDLK